jgi:hypothetical protein
VPKIALSRMDRTLERLRVALRDNRTWLISLLGGFLLGRLTNALSDTSAKMIWSSKNRHRVKQFF